MNYIKEVVAVKGSGNGKKKDVSGGVGNDTVVKVEQERVQAVASTNTTKQSKPINTNNTTKQTK